MQNFEESVMKEIANKALKGLDTDALAKRLAPQLLKNLEKAVVRWFDDDYLFEELLPNSNLDEAVTHALNQTFSKAFGFAEKPPKKKRK